MTTEKLQQVEAAKAALGKATPRPWVAGRPDMATLVDGVESKWIYAGDQYLAVASGRINGPWEEVIANSQILAAAPVLVERVIELEAEVQRLKEWQGKAVPYLQNEKTRIQFTDFDDGEDMPYGLRDIADITALIAQAQGGER